MNTRFARPTRPTIVVNIVTGRPGISIVRGSPYGNPFTHQRPVARTRALYPVATISDAIDCYRVWLLLQPEFARRVRRELRGQILRCWCKPGRCHGDVLVEICDSTDEEFEAMLARTAEAYGPLNDWIEGGYQINRRVDE